MFNKGLEFALLIKESDKYVKEEGLTKDKVEKMKEILEGCRGSTRAFIMSVTYGVLVLIANQELEIRRRKAQDGIPRTSGDNRQDTEQDL